MQARHQVGSPPQAPRGVRRHPQGGLLQNQNQPKKGPEASRQEVVLRAHQGVRLGLNNLCNTNNINNKVTHRCGRNQQQQPMILFQVIFALFNFHPESNF